MSGDPLRHPLPVPEEPARLAAIPAECLETYRIHNPIIAELHRTREALYREQQNEVLILKDEPPRKKH